MRNNLYKAVKGILTLGLMLGMVATNVPFGLLDYAYEAARDRNVVDLMWQAEHSRSVVDALFTPKALAAPTPAVYKGTFSVSPTTGTQTISGVGFTPSAVLFFWTEQDIEGTNISGDAASIGVGFTTGTANERAVSYWTETAAAADTGRYTSETSMIVVQNGLNGTLLAQAALDSFNSDGFVANWTTVDGIEYLIHYVAFNSAVVTSAIAETFSLTTGTGNLSVSNAGFQPEFVMFISGMTSTHDTNTAEGGIMVGAAQSSTAEWVIIDRSEDAGASADTCIQQRTDNSIAFIAHDGGANDCNVQDALADFTQFTSNGFDLNKSDAPAVARDVFYLALAGPAFTVGSLTAPTTPGNQTVSSLAFQPDGLFFAGFGIAATTAVTANTLGGFSIGAAASTSVATAQGAVATTDLDADGSPDPDIRTVTSGLYTEIETASGTTVASTSLVSMNSNGFTLDWDLTDGTANQVLWWAIEQGPDVADTNPPTPDPPYFEDPAGLPTPASASSITASSTIVTDAASPPVEYYFGNINDDCGADAGTGGTDSGWQSSSLYTDTGLQPNQCYGYKLQARDSAATINYTATSTTASTTYTHANIPSAPTVSEVTQTTFKITNNENSNPSANPTTEFAVQVVNTTDTYWDNMYINESGNPSATAVWLPDSFLENKFVSGLQPGVAYEVQVKARNADGVETSFSGTTSLNADNEEPSAGRGTRFVGNVLILGGVRLL